MNSVEFAAYLFGISVTAALAALATPRGWRTAFCVVVAIAFAGAAAWVWLKPDQIPLVAAAWFAPAITPPITLLLVWLYVGSRKHAFDAPPGEPEVGQPENAPDISFERAVLLIAGSGWAEQEEADYDAIARELRDKLHMRRLSAFGRPASSHPIEIIPWRRWAELRLELDSGCAVDPQGRPIYLDIQFNSEMIVSRWPQARV